MATIFDNLLKPTPIDFRQKPQTSFSQAKGGEFSGLMSSLGSFFGNMFSRASQARQMLNQTATPKPAPFIFPTKQIGGFTVPQINLPGVGAPFGQPPATPQNQGTVASTAIPGVNFTPLPLKTGGETTPSTVLPQTNPTGPVSPQPQASQPPLTPSQDNPNQATTLSGAVVNPQTGQVISAPKSESGATPQTPNAAEATGLAAVLKQIEGLSPEQKQLLGLAETPEQKTQRDAMKATLDRLVTLQEELVKSSAPKEEIQNLDRMIFEQTNSLRDLTPGKFLESQRGLKDVGISQAQLEREVASRREPIARGLADLLFSRSVMGEIQKQQIESVTSRISQVATTFELQQALTALAPKQALPQALQTGIFEQFAKQAFGGGLETQVVEADGRKRLINSKTGAVIRDLGAGEAAGGASGDLVATVLANPELFSRLPGATQAALAPALFRMGFDQFGQPLSDTAIQQITDSQTAVEGLEELKGIIGENQDVIGPISGLARLNPFSKAKRVQARIDAVKQRVGKALEGGVLRKEDEEKYNRILATISDRPETALSKVNFLINDVNRQMDTFLSLQKASGRNVNFISKSGASSAIDNFLSGQGL